MRNFLLIPGPVTDPHGLVDRLDRHPAIAALPPVNLGDALHEVARRAVAEGMSARRGGEELVRIGRVEGGAALRTYFDELRRHTPKSTIVLFDPQGPMFPFLDPPEVELLVLKRDPSSAAASIGARGIGQVVRAAHEATAAFERRVADFGIPDERVHLIEEERLEEDPATAWCALCRTLGVEATEAAVTAMAASSVAPWSLRGQAR